MSTQIWVVTQTLAYDVGNTIKNGPVAAFTFMSKEAAERWQKRTQRANHL